MRFLPGLTVRKNGLALRLFLLGLLPLQRSLQVADLFFDFLAAFDGVEEDVVRIAKLLVPFVVHALEAN